MNQHGRRSACLRAAHTAWILTLLTLALPTPRALGQSGHSEHSEHTDMGAPLGWIYVSQLPDQPIGTAAIEYHPPFQTYTFYVVADIDFADVGAPEQNALNGIQAWEGRLEFSPELTLLSAEFEGTNGGASDRDILVDVGLPIVLADSTPRTLATLTFLVTSDLSPGSQIALRNSTNPLATGVIGWREALDSNGCTSPETGAAVACFHPFELVERLDFVRFGATEPGTWTGVKHTFR